MKLNIGCGKVYKKGYTNIDAYDDTVADEIQTATDLRFEDDSIEKIDACQVIEHLGFVESNYALAEWFRVLKPGGNLLVETPDIEASFKSFLKASDQDRRDLLIWIFGIGTPGMKHGLCFPLSMLIDLLDRTGFVDVRHTSFASEKNRPSLRIVCKKPEVYSSSQLIADFRKQVSKRRIIDIKDETEALDLENLIDFLVSRMKNLKETGNEEDENAEILAEFAVFNPKVASCLAQELEKNGSLETAIEELDKIRLPRILTRLFMGIRITPGKQKETFKLVHKMGTEAIRKVILSYDESVLGSLTKAASEMGERYQQEVKSFSEEALRRLSDKLFHQGTKAFTLRKYDEAGEKFSGSILLFRDNILSYVNLARIMKTLGNRREADSNYDNALIMLSLFDYEGNDTMRKVIEEERQARKKVMEPILSLGELMSGA